VSQELPEAVVFDFDGTLIDTEWPIYQTASAVFAGLGHDLPVAAWATLIGLAEGAESIAALDAMCAGLGVSGLTMTEFDRLYMASPRLDRDTLPLQDGVAGLLDALDLNGVPVGVASSSNVEWIERHLGRLGFRDRFASVVGADRTGVGKPAPDVYLLACAELGADPSRSVALEDSANGVAAAKAAGMTCIAVASRITVHCDLSGADRQVSDLAHLTLADFLLPSASRRP
jgi:HAD superfamily hydrolase (TIGR01509 family)